MLEMKFLDHMFEKLTTIIVVLVINSPYILTLATLAHQELKNGDSDVGDKVMLVIL